MCPHFKEGGELGAGVHKASKNKHTDPESSAMSHGCVNINTPWERGWPLISAAALRCFVGTRSPAFQRVEGVQCYLPVPGSLTNSTLKASWMSEHPELASWKIQTEIVCKVVYNRSPQLELKTASETFLKAAIQGRRMGHMAESWHFPLTVKARKSQQVWRYCSGGLWRC